MEGKSNTGSWSEGSEEVKKFEVKVKSDLGIIIWNKNMEMCKLEQVKKNLDLHLRTVWIQKTEFADFGVKGDAG